MEDRADGLSVSADDYAPPEREATRPRSVRAGHLILALLIAVSLAGQSWILAVTGEASRVFARGSFGGSSNRDAWTTFNSADGWSVEFPSSWRARRIDDIRRGSPYTPEVRAIAITNVDVPLRRSNCGRQCWSPWVENVGLSSDGVLVQIGWSYGGGFVCIPRHTASRRLSLVDAARETRRAGADGTPQVRLALSFVGDRQYAVTAWVGSRVSPRDFAVLEEIVGSIMYRSLRPRVPIGDPSKVGFC